MKVSSSLLSPQGQSQQSKASVYWPQVAAEGSFSRCRCSESPGERRPPATPAVRLVGGALSPLAGPGIPSPPAARALLLSWPLGRRAGRTQRITTRFRSAPAPGETAPAPAHCKLAGRSRRGWGCLQSFQIKTSKTASAPFGIRCFRLDSRKHWPPSLFPLCRPLQLLLAQRGHSAQGQEATSTAVLRPRPTVCVVDPGSCCGPRGCGAPVAMRWAPGPAGRGSQGLIFIWGTKRNKIL